MDFTRSTVTSDMLDDDESKANLARRVAELNEAKLVRDKTLGEDYPRVRDFYRGRHVFITGATGFIGKVVVEKLLRVCPDIGNIYVLLRPRKGQDHLTRAKAMLDVPLFDRLRQENPAALDKVVAIKGDCLEDNLGIDPADRRMLAEQVSVVFHSAATVRFTDAIERAIQLNLNSTVDVVALAREMKQLQALVHVSTAYCNTHRNPTQECVYDTEYAWRDVLKYAKLPDAHQINALGRKFLGAQPNAYVFTKALGESVVSEAANELPVVIVRPSIVTCAVEDPIPGWMDNLNGFAMFWAVASKGVMRWVYSPKSIVKYDLVPVDVVSNLTILASWAKGTNQPLPIPAGNVEVVNISLGDVKPSTSYMMQTVLRRHAEEGTAAYPGAVRYPRYGICTNKFLAKILIILYHVVFGTVLDTFAVLMGGKAQLMPVYRAIENAFASVEVFHHQEFFFNSDNLWRLLAMAHPRDRQDFDLRVHDRHRDWIAISQAQLMGVAKYALKEKIGGPEDIRKYCQHINRLWWAELCWYVFLAAMATWAIVARFT